MSSFFIDNHGCAKNQVDAEEISARLEGSGWSYTQTAEAADLIIVNSCGFVEDAKKESIGAVVSLRAAWPDKRILLAGCLSQRYGTELAADLGEADGIFGNGDLSYVVAAAGRAMSSDRRPLVPKIAQPAPVDRTRLFSFPRSAYLKIAEGCSNRCSYCAIPLIRGGMRSRPMDDVLAEASALVQRGIFEINLIGQDLGSYGTDLGGRAMLPELLDGLRTIDADFRVRMLYIHPDHFPMEVLATCAADPRILPYFDIPFQHAAEPVLRAMGRKGDTGTYLRLVDAIRSRLPAAALRSTFLVGFPGETADDFGVLRDFQDRARLEWLGAFVYSREDGTPAAAYKARVPKRIAAWRKATIEDAQLAITGERLRAFLGRELEVLVEERIQGEDLAIGRAYLNAPDVDGLVVLDDSSCRPGDVIRARVTAVNGVDLEAARVHGARPD
ncbi:MAG: 30S ribosomal protein S12 methylthiotransferase RimO [Spirochaetes bacterium]|nr:30S ribosomal protein S12 methylthiotransferase RimO [Spirochaetota bacterium]